MTKIKRERRRRLECLTRKGIFTESEVAIARRYGDRFYVLLTNGQEQVWTKGFLGRWKMMWPGDESFRPRNRPL